MMSRTRILLCAASTAAMACAAGAAFAQAPAGAQPSGAAVEEVIVTGSRIARTGTFTTPTPVTAVTQEQLQAAAPSTIAAGLQTLPSVTPGGGPSASGGTANGGQNFLNLRGLGANRTLILLDNHRFTTSSATGVVDVNLIPAGLVSRVDVVTGGASAAYGSDAVGGVINFILDTKFTGFKVDASYGESMHNDNEDTHATMTYGRDFAGDRGHFVISGEYYENKGVRGDGREFRRHASNIIPNVGGTPSQVTALDIRVPSTTGSLIVNGVGGTAANNALFQGIQFGPGGLPMPYSYGTLSSGRGTAAGFQSGGDGYQVSTGQEIARPLDRQTLFARTDYDLTEKVNVFVEAFYGQTQSLFENSPNTSNATIQRDNAYLARVAPDIVARMTALGVPRLSITRYTLEAGKTQTQNDNYTTQILGGLRGDIHGWTWETTFQTGKNRNKSVTYANQITPRLAFAVDAVTDPSSGNIVCRATLPGAGFNAAAAGCQPFNPFGAGSPSAAALAYIMGNAYNLTETKQLVAEAQVSGDLFNLPAGAVSLAVGGDWRKEEMSNVSDALSQAGSFRLVNSQPTQGDVTVKEAFAEMQVPILKDLPFVRSLDINLAGRHTDYSTSGVVNTWKVGVSWAVNSELRFRATRSRDIRAPNLQELFAAGRQNNQTIDDALGGGPTGRLFLAVPNKTFGNVDLDPEKATTTVMGFVYQPAWLPSFSMAIDAYAIRINDSIGTIGAQNAVTQCNLSGQASTVCALVHRDAALNIIGTDTLPFNLTVQKTDGIDFEASYRVPLSDWFTQDLGSLQVRFLASNVKQNVTLSPLVTIPINNAGTGAQPHWRGTLTFNYEKGPWRAQIMGRYVGDLTWDKMRTLGVDTNFNHIPDRAYMDGQLTYRPESANGKREYYLNVQNILDRAPAFDPSPTGATPVPTETSLYDQVGRMVRVGVRLRY